MDLTSENNTERYKTNKREQLFSNNIKLNFRQDWTEKLKQDKKLILYKSIKTNFGFEEYLKHIKNLDHRKKYTSIRISSHHLNIELGRYANQAKKDRICTICKSNKIEDECHFLINCPIYQYSDHRNVLFSKITKTCPNFTNLNEEQKVQYIMTAEGQYVKIISDFIHEAMEIRESHLIK